MYINLACKIALYTLRFDNYDRVNWFSLKYMS